MFYNCCIVFCLNFIVICISESREIIDTLRKIYGKLYHVEALKICEILNLLQDKNNGTIFLRVAGTFREKSSHHGI